MLIVNDVVYYIRKQAVYSAKHLLDFQYINCKDEYKYENKNND